MCVSNYKVFVFVNSVVVLFLVIFTIRFDFLSSVTYEMTMTVTRSDIFNIRVIDI
jgi:hypothetical protein